MGTGKSTIGKLLSEDMDYAYCDTDTMIEKKFNLSITEIFQKFGEEFFRNVETEMLKSIDNSVVSCGGGIILKEKNRIIINNSGRTFLLVCEVDELLNRLNGSKTRPLLNTKDPASFLNDMWEKRRKLYHEAADYILDVNQKSIYKVVNEIIKEIEND